MLRPGTKSETDKWIIYLQSLIPISYGESMICQAAGGYGFCYPKIPMANRVNDHFISLGKYLQNSLDVIIMSLIGFEEVFAMTPLFIEFTVCFHIEWKYLRKL